MPECDKVAFEICKGRFLIVNASSYFEALGKLVDVAQRYGIALHDEDGPINSDDEWDWARKLEYHLIRDNIWDPYKG